MKQVLTNLVFLFQYSLDNEAERQKLELRAQRVQLEMEQQLGTSTHCLRRQEERFQAVRRIEQEIETLSGIESRTMTEHEPQVTSRRVLGSNPGPGRQHHVPRSANLEQLYHQSLPMDKALSHSGPPVFGNSHLHQVNKLSEKMLVIAQLLLASTADIIFVMIL